MGEPFAEPGVGGTGGHEENEIILLGVILDDLEKFVI